MAAHDSGWKWWLTFSFPPDFHRLHWHQLAWRTADVLLAMAGIEMDLKTIALNSRPPLAKLKEFTRGYKDGQRVEVGRFRRGQRRLVGADGTEDCFTAGRAGVRHFNNTDLVEIQSGRSWR